ncbi:hypothetical protein ACQ86N_23050 [Puia sp. P3]|uniref:hypothetical protein n=1 Tax=Puia sp. P3 TaxID=3423952 RepID=UPI003D67C684
MHRDEYLKTLCGLGFPLSPVLVDGLDVGLASGNNHFEIYSEATFDNNKMGAQIHLYKLPESDEYSISKYEASTKSAVYPFEERKNGFAVIRRKAVTFKEAYNLLQGRPILKDFLTPSQVSYSAWMDLNLTERDISGNYREVKYSVKGFDLETAVKMYPIKELQEEDSANDLIGSLQRGDRVEVSFLKKRTVEKMFIEVNIKMKLLTIIPLVRLK